MHFLRRLRLAFAVVACMIAPLGVKGQPNLPVLIDEGAPPAPPAMVAPPQQLRVLTPGESLLRETRKVPAVPVVIERSSEPLPLPIGPRPIGPPYKFMPPAAGPANAPPITNSQPPPGAAPFTPPTPGFLPPALEPEPRYLPPEPPIAVAPKASKRISVNGSVEYLHWWVKNGNTPPLVTSNSDPTTVGSLSESGTRVLFGGRGAFQFPAMTGARATFGIQFPGYECLSLEGSGFCTEYVTRHFAASSLGGFAPVVSIPLRATVAFNGNPIGETALNAGNSPNEVVVESYSRIWGADARSVIRLVNHEKVRINAGLGARYVQLTEGLALQDSFYDDASTGLVVVRDQFGTDNQFYGGLIGLNGQVNCGKAWLSFGGDISFGVMRQNSDIEGTTTVTRAAFGFPTGTTDAGILAQPSNAGHNARNAFAVVPTAQVKLGYQFTRNFDAWAGYDFMYLSNVIRPGTQIDRLVNPTQNTVFLTPTGTPAPTPSFTNVDYFAHGVNVGVRLRY